MQTTSSSHQIGKDFMSTHKPTFSGHHCSIVQAYMYNSISYLSVKTVYIHVHAQIHKRRLFCKSYSPLFLSFRRNAKSSQINKEMARFQLLYHEYCVYIIYLYTSVCFCERLNIKPKKKQLLSTSLIHTWRVRFNTVYNYIST